MNRRNFNKTISLTLPPLVIPTGWSWAMEGDGDVRVGVIGLDTSHAGAFTKIINAREDGKPGTGFMVTHAFPQGSLDIASSVERIPQYTEAMRGLGVEITSSVAELLDQVDVVLLETNDGRRHLEQALEVFESGKTTFIDKPIAASLSDTKAIFSAAKKHGVPVFSASSLRYGPGTQEVVGGKIGTVLAADTYSPAKIEPTHPDLFWYGIHGVESLFTVLGTGCISVQRTYKKDMDVVVGEWNDGRIGTFRGLRTPKTSYGGMAFGTDGIAPVGMYEGYDHLVYKILDFFRSGQPPVSAEETIEIFAFMAAAQESKYRNGAAVMLTEFQ